jgi:hypothetical protein
MRRKAHSEPLPSYAGRKAPGLSTTTPPEDPALLSTIDRAITPWCDAFPEQTTLPHTTQHRPAPEAGWSPRHDA